MQMNSDELTLYAFAIPSHALLHPSPTFARTRSAILEPYCSFIVPMSSMSILSMKPDTVSTLVFMSAKSLMSCDSVASPVMMSDLSESFVISAMPMRIFVYGFDVGIRFALHVIQICLPSLFIQRISMFSSNFLFVFISSISLENAVLSSSCVILVSSSSALSNFSNGKSKILRALSDMMNVSAFMSYMKMNESVHLFSIRTMYSSCSMVGSSKSIPFLPMKSARIPAK